MMSKTISLPTMNFSESCASELAGRAGLLQERRERLLRRARLLPPEDQFILNAILYRGMSMRDLGRRLGHNPGTVCRRVRKMLHCLDSPMVVALLDTPDGLAEHYRQVGIDRFLLGLSISSMSRRHALSRHEVLGILAYLRLWLTSIKGAGIGEQGRVWSLGSRVWMNCNSKKLKSEI
jgi:hypothetical protein